MTTAPLHRPPTCHEHSRTARPSINLLTLSLPRSAALYRCIHSFAANTRRLSTQRAGSLGFPLVPCLEGTPASHTRARKLLPQSHHSPRALSAVALHTHLQLCYSSYHHHCHTSTLYHDHHRRSALLAHCTSHKTLPHHKPDLLLSCLSLTFQQVFIGNHDPFTRKSRQIGNQYSQLF